MSRLVYILNGPNLNLLGRRQPKIYGYETLADGLAAPAHAVIDPARTRSREQTWRTSSASPWPARA